MSNEVKTDQDQTGKTDTDQDNKQEKTFTQAELNAIVIDRLKNTKEKLQATETELANEKEKSKGTYQEVETLKQKVQEQEFLSLNGKPEYLNLFKASGKSATEFFKEYPELKKSTPSGNDKNQFHDEKKAGEVKNSADEIIKKNQENKQKFSN